MLKKKTFIVIVCITLPILAGYIFYRPIPIIPPGTEVEILRVQRRTHVGSMSEDITELINTEEVVNILRRYYTRRTFHNPFPTMGDDMWNINFFILPSGWRNFRQMAIGGRNNVMVRNADDTILHRIINWEELMEELQQLKDENVIPD